ncbi:MAG: dTDP-glucose 4,6-dehydratase [Candidatus Omnitrophota bacterium]
MRKKLSKILVTGGAGFIGSAFARQAIKKGYKVIIVDKLTYAGDVRRLAVIKGKYKFYKVDICDQNKIERIFEKEKPDCVVNFSAETHVDRSIKSAKEFIETNVVGTEVLLCAVRQHKIKKFIQLSTDEIYGDIKKGEFFEDFPLNPSSPYSASKAAADLLIKSYIRTYNFPAIIVRPSNNYGPWQYPEKLIPRAILTVLKGGKIPVYAKGKNVREWLYVEDCASGILKILESGKIGEIYNIGSGQEKENIYIVKGILKAMRADSDGFEFVRDRPGHDIRYKLNSDKLKKDISWEPKVKIDDGLKFTVNWCLENKSWLLSKSEEVAALYKK